MCFVCILVFQNAGVLVNISKVIRIVYFQYFKDSGVLNWWMSNISEIQGSKNWLFPLFPRFRVPKINRFPIFPRFQAIKMHCFPTIFHSRLIPAQFQFNLRHFQPMFTESLPNTIKIDEIWFKLSQHGPKLAWLGSCHPTFMKDRQMASLQSRIGQAFALLLPCKM